MPTLSPHPTPTPPPTPPTKRRARTLHCLSSASILCKVRRDCEASSTWSHGDSLNSARTEFNGNSTLQPANPKHLKNPNTKRTRRACVASGFRLVSDLTSLGFRVEGLGLKGLGVLGFWGLGREFPWRLRRAFLCHSHARTTPLYIARKMHEHP